MPFIMSTNSEPLPFAAEKLLLTYTPINGATCKLFSFKFFSNHIWDVTDSWKVFGIIISKIMHYYSFATDGLLI